MLSYYLFESDLINTGKWFCIQKHDHDSRMAYMDFEANESDVSDCLLYKVRICVTLLF